MSIVLIFFFQAEDGIRDFHVTGVQTCALPISPSYTNGNLNFYTPKTNGGISSSTKFSLHVADNITDPDAHVASFHGRVKGRSEERRVGKESRCLWSRGE